MAKQLTQKGYEELQSELAWREGEKAAEIVERIREARDFGDLSENAEYDAAKEEQANNEAKIKELKAILADAIIVAELDDADIAEKGVSINTEVDVEDSKGNLRSFTIVGTTETNSLAGEISNESPLGQALTGQFVGDTVEFVTPSGQTRSYTIKAIRASQKSY
ncbi:MAG: transcription elongation factor GreA [Atopobiaceae bacterium]|nr:transcription elongation factor GreA [Atopobiaceae bacterium]